MRILFLRFGSIGNAVVSIPAVRAVRREMKTAFLALLCDPLTYEFWKRCPWLDKILVYDQRGKNKPVLGYLRMISEIRSLKFSHTLHFRRFIRSELIGFLSGAETRIGFDPGTISLLNRKFPYRDDEHIIFQNLKLLKAIGINADDPHLEYWAGSPSPKVKAIIEKLGKGVVVIHPFARTQREKRWKKYPELIENLQREFSLKAVLIGKGDERDIFEREWNERAKGFLTAFDLEISELASLLKEAVLFIGNDSGPLHLAVAVGTPAIGIYGPRADLENHLKKWMPLGENFKPVLPPKYCSLCSRHPCTKEEMSKCFEEISVDEVLSRVENLGFRRKA